jgi:creatinine amidohydrolase
VTLPDHLEKALPQVNVGDETATTVFLAETLKPKDTGKHTSTREMTRTGVWSDGIPAKLQQIVAAKRAKHTFDASVQFIKRWRALKPLKPLAERRDY